MSLISCWQRVYNNMTFKWREEMTKRKQYLESLSEELGGQDGMCYATGLNSARHRCAQMTVCMAG